jgi:hypothetical protein
MAVEFLGIEKDFVVTWHLSLQYKLSKLKFSISLIKLTSSFFFSQRKLRLPVEGDIQAGMPQGSILSPPLYSTCINDKHQTPGAYLGLFADDTCIYAADRIEAYVLRKLLCGLSDIETWSEHWNIKSMKMRCHLLFL